uniref:Odorant receptors OR16 n=1 Tax=Lobesia botrana TaxID=209534 RepID=A0A345BEU7_9NEOP|nr:odorant receptors OR16 [Lobesia botrana]
MTILKEVRNFGLDRHDFPTLVSNSTILLRILTLNVDSRYNKRISIASYFIMLLSAMSYIYTYQVSTFWFIFFRDVENQRTEKIIAFAQCNICIVGVIKFLSVYWNKETLKKIVDAYLECDSEVTPHSRMSGNIDKTLRTVKKRALILWLIITVNVSMYLIIRP